MSNKRKVHMMHKETPFGHSPEIVWFYCGWESNAKTIFTLHEDLVTCKMCIKSINAKGDA